VKFNNRQITETKKPMSYNCTVKVKWSYNNKNNFLKVIFIMFKFVASRNLQRDEDDHVTLTMDSWLGSITM